jgi:hypothetical protein
MLDLLNECDEYHTDIIRSQLTRNIADTFKEVREELIMAMAAALDDLIPTREDGAWQYVQPDARPGFSKRNDVSPTQEGVCAQSRPNVSG